MEYECVYMLSSCVCYCVYKLVGLVQGYDSSFGWKRPRIALRGSLFFSFLPFTQHNMTNLKPRIYYAVNKLISTMLNYNITNFVTCRHYKYIYMYTIRACFFTHSLKKRTIHVIKLFKVELIKQHSLEDSPSHIILVNLHRFTF